MLTKYPATKSPPTDGCAEAFWIDLFDPTPEEAARVASEYGIRVPSRAALQEIETSSRVHAEGRTLYVSMPLASRDEAAAFVPVPLGFVLSPDVVVTIRYSELHAFAGVEARVQDGTHSCSAAVFVALLEGLVDFGADTLEKLGADLAMVSARAFNKLPAQRARHKLVAASLRQSLDQVGAAGDQLSRFRESLLGLQRISGFVADSASDWMPAEFKARLQTVRQDLHSLIDYEEHLFAKTQFLLDATLGLISTEQNEIFKVLTIVSVVGVPPTLIASLYGMNFHAMPELNWEYGYPYALGLIALSTVLPIIWFKRRGWW
jgi:magnesium transporter